MTPERIFVDTNLFLRYFTNDIPEQAEVVDILFRQAGKSGMILITNHLVIAEIVWTLESYYHLSKAEIQRHVLAILNTPDLEVANSDILFQAIMWYAEKNVDFIDAFNAAWMLHQGITFAYSFDRKHFNRFAGITTHTPGEENP